MSYLPMPPPLPYEESEEFWQACKRREMVIERCENCGEYRHPPLPLCPSCQSRNYRWTKVSGKGRVECFTIVEKALFPGLPTPYNIVRVELREQKGLLVLGNLIDCDPEDIRIDMPLEVTFEDVGRGVTMYYFKKSG